MLLYSLPIYWRAESTILDECYFCVIKVKDYIIKRSIIAVRMNGEFFNLF